MTENIKELVKRLRDQKFQYSGPQPDVMNEVADALEALAGEVERWRAAFNRLQERALAKEQALADCTAERDRLKAALEGIACNADEATDLPLFRVQCRDFARKALGRRPSPRRHRCRG